MKLRPIGLFGPTARALMVGGLLLAGDCALRGVHAAPDPAPPRAITAQSFRLVDSSGKLRGEFATLEDGTPALSLFDRDGNRRASLRVRADGSSVLGLHNTAGRSIVQLDTLPDGSASIAVTDKQGKSGAAIVILPAGDPAAVIRSREGKVVWSAPEPEIQIKPEDKK